MEASLLAGVRVGAIIVGAIMLNVGLSIALDRFFVRADSGDADRIASLRQVARTAQRLLLTAIAGLLILDTVGVDIGALIAALGIIGLAVSFGAQPLIRDIIGYISFVLADNFRTGEAVMMDGKRGEVLKFELRCVVLRMVDDSDEWLAYVPYSKIGTLENFGRAIEDA
ncbi:MAG: mechanosensitive ion channel [Actinomycetota bacterium]|nr:mechanosensitive ion channel [Actinomycetota bacterium]